MKKEVFITHKKSSVSNFLIDLKAILKSTLLILLHGIEFNIKVLFVIFNILDLPERLEKVLGLHEDITLDISIDTSQINTIQKLGRILQRLFINLGTTDGVDVFNLVGKVCIYDIESILEGFANENFAQVGTFFGPAISDICENTWDDDIQAVW